MKKLFVLLLLVGCQSTPYESRQVNKYEFCSERASDYVLVCEEHGARQVCNCTPKHAVRGTNVDDPFSSDNNTYE